MNDAERARIQGWLDPSPPRKLSPWSRIRGYFSGETAFRAHVEDVKKRAAPIFREMLDDNQVEVHSVRSVAVVQLVQYEDEGSTYFFDVGDGWVFCLRDDTGVEGSPDWPNSHFDLVRSRRHLSSFQQVSCHGSKLVPARIIRPSFELWGLLPDSGVVKGTLSTIERDLAGQHLPKEPGSLANRN